MGLNSIHEQINTIQAILKRWEKATSISDIERELLLDKLKIIYEEVMFLERETPQEDLPIETFEEPAPTPKLEPEQQAAPVAAVAEQAPQASEPQLKEEVEVEIVVFEEEEAKVEEQQEENELREEEAFEFTAEEDEEAKSVGCMAETAAEPSPEATETTEPEPTPHEATVEQQLFDDRVLIRNKVDKRVIMSLYGDGPSTGVSHPSATTVTPATTATPTQPTSQVQSSAPQTIADNAPTRKVFGEMLSNNTVPLNDRIGQQQTHQDVSSKMQSRQITGGLRQHIGLNDKFLLIRDLFGGSAVQYEETINLLEEFSDFDEVMIYIQEHFSWNPDSEGTRLLIDLLQRKLG